MTGGWRDTLWGLRGENWLTVYRTISISNRGALAWACTLIFFEYRRWWPSKTRLTNESASTKKCRKNDEIFDFSKNEIENIWILKILFEELPIN